MHETIFTIYTTDPDTGSSVYQCETTDENLAQDEVDRLNDNMSRAGVPCTAYYTP
jgi:C4-type Zn-finger protein